MVERTVARGGPEAGRDMHWGPGHTTVPNRLLRPRATGRDMPTPARFRPDGPSGLPTQPSPHRSHCPSFEHAEIAALYEMVLRSTPWRPRSSSSPSARSHCPPFEHAEIAALYVMVLRSTLLRPISSSSPSARSL